MADFNLLIVLEQEKKRKAEEENEERRKIAKNAGVPENFFDAAKTKVLQEILSLIGSSVVRTDPSVIFHLLARLLAL